ncbi:nucleotidyl transferase AbiEii/AbiGii toxin family protein [Streptococcus salivarius]|jgi:predicted nucleotidyltransferase component of viral defense system|uniref:nucleotidyl transferase AbiEii/AbiGii toxin family protein n=1 Tax=Streptococcus salivarius TaxID=1304 RepID=UPI000225114F|nr:nucleotidyl transferase AbiEii/AbiGii toxin family protein [Streptococcus salivarius]EGX29437.1 abortive infection protein AbiGII [Streptococcus salivarius M18]MBZ5846699.1 nucleotidyl transferase AbiEii/AbiGii toxin family protein [Streptococcus salivarius]RGR60193.1 nucleotidyl transferase AbiEii/AbiGii toxin family protein [Streptococcus salivarius]
MFSNANSFKAKIKNMAKDRGIPAQQLQQNFLIEQVLKLIAKSSYKDSFIVKGGYLIGQLIGLDKRTTMDLDVTLKGTTLSQENLISIFEEILSDSDDVFSFEVDKLEPIRQDDEYGGFSLKLNATFDTLREVVFIDITTGDKITPREITYSMPSLFKNETIEVWTYNLETVLAEKLETIISRGVASTRPRDRYDLFTLYHIRKDEINFDVLREALANTVEKRGSKEAIDIWESQLNSIETDEYQKQLWTRYQRQFKYAQDISFEKSVQIVRELMTTIM